MKKIFISISIILNIIFIFSGSASSSFDYIFQTSDKIEKSYSYTDKGEKMYIETELNSSNNPIYRKIVVNSDLIKELYFYINGKIKEEYNYKNGRKNGAWSSYRDNGSIKEDGIYQDGVLKEIANYYPSGSIKQLSFSESNKIRLITTYYPNGNIESQGKKILSKNGNEAFYGRWIWYNYDGTFKDEMVFNSSL
ncbi:MAG: hypothetical protein CBD97_00685 [Pelagibacteraceae bacterium TMED237]|nr:hypothetical protein [Candidatus Neomarinimicrobiota bacterium]OUW96735.1 MAG: hypothetical protein CBD97_00685 [Pelagibacteraceae bacterium TMED237]|tara:strand:- start:4512 stop:5093 length:582 start_codon:yes stop_codon:yes gene_type:complete